MGYPKEPEGPLVAAVPQGAGTSFSDSPPGHRFGVYFSGWQQGGWQLTKDHRSEVLQRVADSPPRAYSELVARVRARQEAVARSLPASLLTLVRTVAPLTTGLGNEHPLENGFAFLSPYGAPYLPGSTLKGVVRRAAEELALFEPDSPWTIVDAWELFGYSPGSVYLNDKPSKQAPDADEWRAWRDAYRRHVEDPLVAGRVGRWDARSEGDNPSSRGNLLFWDAFPSGTAADLRVEIMNPHFPQYQQGSRDPTDDQNPTPLNYLAIAPGTSFQIVVEAQPLLDDRCPSWRNLVREAIEFAFTWIGVGAKTSQGFGRLERDLLEDERSEQVASAQVEEAARLRREAKERSRLESMTPAARLVNELESLGWEDVGARYGELDHFSGTDQVAIARAFKAAYERHGKWTKPNEKQAKKVDRIKSILAGGGEQV